MGILEQEWILRRASVLHDLGKIGVRETVSNKPGKLSPEEFLEVVRNPALVSILEPIQFFRPLLPTVLHTTSGTSAGATPPAGGDRIPVASRILAVAATFEAMTYTRLPKALAGEDAVASCAAAPGRVRPDIVPIFLSCLPRTDPRGGRSRMSAPGAPYLDAKEKEELLGVARDDRGIRADRRSPRSPASPAGLALSPPPVRSSSH
jgi:hypothetical protein